MSFSPKSSYSKEEILASSRGELFGPGNAKLPAPNMLMIDRIVEINNDGGKHGLGQIIAEIDINPDLCILMVFVGFFELQLELLKEVKS